MLKRFVLTNAKNYYNLLVITIASIGFYGAYCLNIDHTSTAAIIMLTIGLLLYGFYALTERSFLSIRALFSLVWLGSIGLALLRLNKNQVPWLPKTWLVYWLAYISFLLGYMIHDCIKRKHVPFGVRKFGCLNIEKRQISEKGFFIVLMVFSAVCLGAFFFEWLCLGFLPALSSDMNAYVKFHMKGIHYFTVSCVLIFPLTYYYWKRYHSSLIKKIILVLINLVAFLIPLLIVSRQLYILSIILGMMAVISVGKKRELICGIVAVVILFTGWFALSQLRNQDTEYLENIFNSSSEIENPEEKPNDGEEPEDPEGSDDFAFNSSYNIEDFFYAGKNFSRNEIQLPMYLYQPYMYVAFNFDNFNYSLFRIGNHHSYGLKTLFPVFALTNTKNMIPNEDVFPEYTYLQYYTTFPFIYPYYYDFGIVGVVVLMALVGFVCAYMKRISDENIVGHIVYSLLKYAIIFSFFTNFLANATIWFYFAVLFAIYLVTTKRFTISFQKNRPSNKEQVM